MIEKEGKEYSEREDSLAQMFKTRLNAAFTGMGIIPKSVYLVIGWKTSPKSRNISESKNNTISFHKLHQ